MKLLLGDCLERMREIPDGSVDMVMADLPYGTTACKWDAVIPFEPMWRAYKRVCKGAIVLTASMPFTAILVSSNLLDFRYRMVWDKRNPTGFLDAKKRPLRRIEGVLVFASGVYNPQMRTGRLRKKGGDFKTRGAEVYREFDRTSTVNDQYYPTDILEIPSERQVSKQHPTQKPVALMEYLIRTYTNEGMTVLDNTMGSGTTGVACANTGRDFIGIERDPDYFAIAEKRIREAEMAALS